MRELQQKRYYKLGNNYWWLAGKYMLVVWLAEKYKALKRKSCIVDLGCGPGNLLDRISKKSRLIIGLDRSISALQFCQSRGYEFLARADFNETPIASNIIDCVFSIDVIEHLNNDEKALSEIHRILKPGGISVITVPAFMFLWGKHDEIYNHKRRYTLKELKFKATKVGFNPLFISYYEMPFLLPLWIFRKLRYNKLQSDDFIVLPKYLNSLLTKIIFSERLILKYFPLPFGVSIIGIFKKN